YRWVGPFATYDIVLFSLRSRNITISSSEELRNYTIGAVTSDVSAERLSELGVNSENIVTNQDPTELFRLLEAEKIDLVTSGDIAGEYFIKKRNGTPETYRISYRMDSTPLYYAFNKDTPEDLLNRFEQGLDRISLPPADGGMSKRDQVMSAYNPVSGLSSLKFYTEEYYPFNYLLNGTPAGTSVDVLAEVFKRLDVNLSRGQISLGSWDEGYRRTMNQTGTVIFSTARSPEREELFSWAGPVFTESNVIFSHVSNIPEITTPGDLTDLRIGAVTDDIAALDLADVGYRDALLSSDAKILIQALENGTLDGWAYAEHPGKNLIARYAKNPSALQQTYTLKSHDYYFAFNRNTPLPLVQAFQRALDQVKSERDQKGENRND
ncbi:MAG: transporter substrate-binding domain-containing protein, partial [Methanospirillum sp.]|uniref:substrate-binding periplasmic protein n=1 Tax=Methanospirillum sp. TaxID=45200 RepID=UPI00236BE01C